MDDAYAFFNPLNRFNEPKLGPERSFWAVLIFGRICLFLKAFLMSEGSEGAIRLFIGKRPFWPKIKNCDFTASMSPKLPNICLPGVVLGQKDV